MSGNQGLLPKYQNSLPSHSDILSILRLDQDNTPLSENFSKCFETRRFQLGDELAIYNVSNSHQSSVTDG